MASATRRLANPALFVCDLQEKFRPAIHEYEKVIATTQKMLKAARILSIPVFATTQNRPRLGATVAELELDAHPGTKVHSDKTLFSMWTPEVRAGVSAYLAGGPKDTQQQQQQQKLSAVIVGIESHICVTQTTLDLLREGHKVYVLADGVSSCNREEVGVALARLRAEGAVVTTSESWIYECMGDAELGEFREIAKLVKETKEETRGALQALCKM